MGPLKKIIRNCSKATFLIEKKLLGSITFRQNIELRIHLFGCSVCRIYQKQTGKINELVQLFFHNPVNAHARLDDNFKKDLQDRIEEKLNKN